MAVPATHDQPSLSHKTKTAFVSLQVITSSCHGVLNTQFTSPTPKPKWFDGLNSNLDDAKKVANHWVQTLGVDVTSTVPAKVIDYGTTYSALTKEIHSIAKDHPLAKGKDNEYVKQVDELVNALLESVTAIIKDVDDISGKLKAWQSDLQTAHDNLTKGASSIQKAETDLQTDIDKMNNAIKNLNAQIAAENRDIAISAGAIGVGILLFVVGIALAPETGGASLLVSGVGAAGVIGGAVTWGIMQHKINEQYDEINKDTQELNADKRQLVALQGLAQASDLAIQSLAQASSALSDFRTSWSVFEKELKGVKGKLAKADDSLSVLVQDAFTQAAADEWAKATDFAQKLSECKVEVQKKTLPMSGDPKKAEAA
jgi:septal ring factor EnvC (AmiA/AmiB activator)